MWNKLCFLLATISHRMPRGRVRLAAMFLRLQRGAVTSSIYGPLLKTRWDDLTFVFCVAGGYGRYFSDFLGSLKFHFAFIDVGANIGIYSLVAVRNKNCIACYAFEPNPHIYRHLVLNCELNKADIKTFDKAIAGQTGKMVLRFNPRHTGTGSISDLTEHVEKTMEICEVTTIDHTIFNMIQSEVDAPKVVKIDVEGFEPIVVAEMKKSEMWNSIAFIFIEAEEGRYNIVDLINDMKNHDFELEREEGPRAMRNLMFRRRSIRESV